jgi:hypothetical protein
MSKPSLVIIIVEDDHHEMLVRRYLKKRGLENHQMRIKRSPIGEGSAENWVRKGFVKEVKVYRSRHARTALIVIIDADTATVNDRLRQLNQALEVAVDSDTEQIAQLVPKRNIETWICCLTGHAVNEETDYKKRDDWNKLIPHAAETLLQWTQSNNEPPEHCVKSLQHGIKQLKRLRL